MLCSTEREMMGSGPDQDVCSLGSPVIWLPFKLIFFIVQHLFSGGRERLLFCSLKLYTYFFVFKIMDLLHAHNILTYLELSFISQFFRHSELDSVSHSHSLRIEVTSMDWRSLLLC